MVLIHIEIENKIHPNLKSWKEPTALKPATLYLQKPEMPDIARVWPWVKRHIPVRPPPPSCHNGSQSQASPLQPSHYHTLSTCHLPARRNGNNQQHHSHQFFCHSNSELPKVILRWPILVFTRWEGVIKKFFLGLSPQSVTTPNSFVPRSQSDCNKILD